MIPTVILFGLVFGRFWRTSLVVATVAWPLLLLADGTIDVGLGVVAAAALASLNAGLGVLVHQGVLHGVRGLGRSQVS